ncbi:hypothetical protein EBR43_07305 [bacterium]|jgi:hypothetical protein|nr:hypothetical protein [bacterium]
MPKAKTIEVSPISPYSKQKFKSKMGSLSTCKINQESNTHLFLQSANKKVFFMIQKQNDPHWEILK